MNKLKVLAISGSLRTGSYNTKLVQIAVKLAEAAGAEVSILNLKELGLPIYNNDIEVIGMPENVLKFKLMLEAADVFLIGSPENNYSIPAVLKNAIDWGSRGKPNSWGGKTAAIFGASTGPFGTLRMQLHLRIVLTGVNVMVLPQPQVFVANAEDAFDENGSLKNKATEEMLKKLIVKTLDLAAKLKG